MVQQISDLKKEVVSLTVTQNVQMATVSVQKTDDNNSYEDRIRKLLLDLEQ